MAIDDDEGILGSCAVSFRSRALLVAAVYALYFALSMVAIAVASVSEHAIPFAILTPLITASLHLLTSLFELATHRGDALPKLQVPAWRIVQVSDWLVASVVGISSTAIAIRGLDHVRLDETILVNSLMLVGQLGCVLKTTAWLDASLFDQQTGEFLGDGGMGF